MAENGGAANTTEDSSLSMKIIISSFKAKFPSVKNLTTSTLYTWLSANWSGDTPYKHVTLLDTRPDEEYVVSHIEGAKRVDPEAKDVHETLESIKEYGENQAVVCYCSVGYRSSFYAQAISKELKKENLQMLNKIGVYNLEGSLFKWANEEKPMVDHLARPTRYAHPYSKVWGKVLTKELRRSTPDP